MNASDFPVATLINVITSINQLEQNSCSLQYIPSLYSPSEHIIINILVNLMTAVDMPIVLVTYSNERKDKRKVLHKTEAGTTILLQ